MKLRKIILMMTGIVCAALLCGCADTTAAIAPKKDFAKYSEQAFHISKPPRLHIQNDAGNIEIYSWDRKTVKFEITRRIRSSKDEELVEKEFKDFRIEWKQQGDEISFYTSYNGKRKDPIDTAVDLKIYIPKRIVSINCKLDLGKIKIYDDLVCELGFKIYMANVEINRFEGKINFDAHMGDLRISNGCLDKDSKVRIDMGNILIKAAYMEGTYDFSTNMGNIELNVPSDLKVSLEAAGTIEANETEPGNHPVVIKARSGMGKIALKKYKNVQ